MAYIDDDAKATRDWLAKACRIHHETTGWLPKSTRRYLSGSNMFFKRSLLEELGGFKTDLGMNAGQSGYGEETELIARALKQDKPVYHSLDLLVYHSVPPHKMELGYHIFSSFKWGKGPREP